VHLSGQSIYVPTGKSIGGSSSINGILFVRGAKEEYDRWRESQCRGWGYDDILPLLKRIEDRAGGDPRYRGRGGPITVSDVAHKDALSEAFYKACVDYGIAPNRFNPSGKSWLPILHTRRGEWHFTVLFSNTRRAYALNKTDDWVVVYFHTDHDQ
jgi:choline dehydrogenase-like flavoprotein